jgi:hypothetical protein
MVKNVEDINIKITDSDNDPHEFSAHNRADRPSLSSPNRNAPSTSILKLIRAKEGSSVSANQQKQSSSSSYVNDRPVPIKISDLTKEYDDLIGSSA